MTLKEKVTDKIDRLKEYVGYLKTYQKYTLDDLKKDPTLRGAVERYLQLSAECVIDIAEIMIAELGFRKPEEYREAIDILGESGILPDEFAYYFAPIAGFRNILVHEYAKIDLKEVHRHLQHDLADFDKFTGYIIEYLRTLK
ncbi:MAG: type VII toxin-antitoxin system HepT family RNase toxin [Thermodesulfovibrionales bacterium]